MTTLMIKDLTASTELDGKAMAAVAGGSDFAGLLASITSIKTSFPVKNSSKQYNGQSNAVGSFNFGVIDQDNTSKQESVQIGNILAGGGGF
jgi:hypothetical protein